jgi:CBS domain-containing protein
MVPLSEYPVVGENATIHEAVQALQEAQKRFDQSRYRHRAVLVADDQGHIVGKLGQLDMLRALEPKYEDMRTSTGVTRLGFSRKFLVSMLDRYDLFAQPIEQMCRHVFEQKVKRYMQQPCDGEQIEADASLDQALHQLLVCQHQSLLVMDGERIIGILRLTDVFTTVFETIDRCRPPSLNTDKR